MEFIYEFFGSKNELFAKILNTVIIFLIIWLIRILADKISARKINNVQISYNVRKTINYSFTIIGLIVIGRIWFEGFESLTTFLGLLSAGIAISLKDLISNIAGWGFILWRRPFAVGDRIEIGEQSGDVIDLRVFQFTILEIGNWVGGEQSTGRIVHIPNGKVFSSPVANYSKGFQYIWNEINVLVTFESDWRKAKKILDKIAKDHSEHLSKEAEKKVKKAAEKFMIMYTNLTPIVYTSVESSGVLLTIRYLCEPRHRRGSSQGIWESILDEFDKHDNIEFAYPTERFYMRSEENR